MNRAHPRWSIFTIVVLLAVARSISAQSPAVLTLADAVDEALVKNDRLIDQRDTTTHAELGLRLARNAFHPKIIPNILGSFGQTDVSSQVYRVDVAQRFTTGTEMRLGVGTETAQIPGSTGDIRFYNADTTLTLSQPLLKGFGRTIAARALAGARFRQADADRQRIVAEQQVALEVTSAYYRVVAQQAFVDVARLSLERARKLRDASEAKLDAGLVSQLDVLRAQQLVMQAEMQLFDSQSAIEDARDRLLYLIGRQPGESIDVLRAIPPPSQLPIELENATTIALSNRLDLQSRIGDSENADLAVRYARNQLLPQVDVNFALTRRYTADSFEGSFGLNGFQFATFFTIAMPVDRTTQQVEYQTALMDRDRRKRDIATLERQIADEVKRSLRDRDRLLRNVTAAETSVEIARREVEVAQLRHERGLSNNLDVVTAESGLLMAESRRIQALADAAISRVQLRAVLGVLNPRTDMDDAVVKPVLSTSALLR